MPNVAVGTYIILCIKKENKNGIYLLCATKCKIIYQPLLNVHFSLSYLLMGLSVDSAIKMNC